MKMKFTYDKEVDAAYIYVVESIGEGEAVKTIKLNNNIILDFDKDGKLLGIEILDATKILNKEVLLQSQLV